VYHTSLSESTCKTNLRFHCFYFLFLTGCKTTPATTISPTKISLTTIPKTERLVIQVDIDSTLQEIDNFGVSGHGGRKRLAVGRRITGKMWWTYCLTAIRHWFIFVPVSDRGWGWREIIDPWRNTESFEMLLEFTIEPG
jgi:hypothetical protein